MRLLKVEVRRLLSRRVVWLALVAVLVVVGAALFGVHQQATWVNESRANAQEMYEEALEYWEGPAVEDVDRCKADEAQAKRESGDGRIDFGCEEMMQEPQLSDFMGEMPSLAQQYKDMLGYLVHPFLFLALAVGSTHVAAEFSHRTLGSWLTFVPRRVPVFLSKVGAAGVAALPMAAVGVGLLLLLVPVVYRLNGMDGGLTGQQWPEIGWMSLRIVALAMLAGALGAAAAFLLRHSAAVIGIVVGYLVFVEGIIRGLFQQVTPWLLGPNIDAFVQHGTEWVTWPDTCDDITVMCRETVHTLSFTHGTLVLLALLVVVMTLALLRFYRADVD